MSSVAPAKNDNDAYTGTENQHDFGKPPQFLLTRSAVTHDDSQLYRNYVDSKFTWNETTENRGVKIAETTYNQEITETGLNNTNDMGYDHANSPFNPENNPLWAYNDVGIIQRVLNMNKDDLQKSSVGWNVAMEGKKFWRNVEIKSSNAEKLFNYKIIRIPAGKYYGRELARNLEIPNHSITLVDTDQIIGRHLKQFTNRNPANHAAGDSPDKDFFLYWFINPIVSADSARKPTMETSGGPNVFNNHTGITIKALINYESATINCANNDCKLNFKVTTKPLVGGIHLTQQDWVPIGDALKPDDFNPGDLHIEDCKNANNRPTVYPLVKRTLLEGGRTNPKLKSPPDGDKKDYNKAILGLSRKRSGDLFQGYLTKHLFNKNILNGNVTVMMFGKDEHGNNVLDKSGVINLSDSDAPWGGNGANVFHTTGDYPHLAWCLENGLNVLFKPPRTNNHFYFERQ